MKNIIYLFFAILLATGLSAQSISFNGAESQTHMDGARPSKPEMIENRSATTCSDFIYEQGISLSNFNSTGRSIAEIGGNSYKGYDDFTLNATATINKVILTVADFDPTCSSPEFIINFRADAFGSFGQVLETRIVPADAATYTKECIVSPWTNEAFLLFNLHIPIDPVTLGPGTYWIEPYSPNQSTFTDGVFWQLINTVNGSSAKWFQLGSNFIFNLDFAFALSGSTDMPASYCVPAIEALCQNTTVTLGQGGQASITASDVDGGSSGFTNSSVSPSSFDCSNLGDNTVTLNVDDGNGNTDDCTATVTVALPDGLPNGWTATDLGDPGSGSDYSFDPCASNSGDYNIATGGYNLIPNTSDNMAFGALLLCGNGGIQARIESVTGGYAGLMIRESSAPGAKMTAIYTNLTNLLRRETRYATNGNRSSATSNAAFPTMLRLARQGDWIRGFYKNGSQWIQFHQVYLPMNQCVEMGLAVFSTDPFGTATATFTNVNSMSNLVTPGPGGNSSPVALSNFQQARIAPNPTSGAFTLDFERPLEIPATAVLRNELGQAIQQLQLPAGAVNHNFDGSNLPRGLYFLEVRDAQGYREVLKVVRQ